MTLPPLFIDFDLAGAEAAIVAYDSQEPRMIDTFERKKSPHVVTGALISGLPEETVALDEKVCYELTDPTAITNARQASGLDYSPATYVPRTQSIRQAAKRANHALNYGMGYKRFALENEMDEAEARRLCDLYAKAYPGVVQWRSQIEAEVRKSRTLINLFGRKRRFLDSFGPELFDAAYAFGPQSTIVDIVNRGMVRFYDSGEASCLATELMAQVHDSLLFQDLDPQIDRLADFIQIVGLDYLRPPLNLHGRDFHVDTEAKIGLRWHKKQMVGVKVSSDLGAVKASIGKALQELKIAA